VWRVRVVNVRLELGGTASRKDAGRGGEAVVTFEREQRDVTRGTYEAPTRHVATLRYAYEPKAMRTEADRLDNPLGFVVTAYRTDSELKK
jgi:type IV secretion system protein VirB8